MILSNEPGYYREGSFGIRIENLVYIKKNKFKELTMAPIDKDLIDVSLLDNNERKWINKYHEKVFNNLKYAMNTTEILELRKACSAI